MGPNWQTKVLACTRLMPQVASPSDQSVVVTMFASPSYRWLTYLLLLILDLVICLTMCLWMAKQSRWLLIT